MQSPIVSVIIPVYNVEKYLDNCLRTLVSQTLSDIEIICVDDGSTDKSLEILKDYANRDSRITVLEQENSGAAVARNKGMKLAKGKYFSILDSDDYYELDMLEKLVNKAEATGVDTVICRSRRYNVMTKSFLETKYALVKDYLPSKEVFNYKDLPDYIFEFCIGWSWDKLYRADFIRKHNIEFQNLRSTNDMLFVFMALVLAEKITCIDDVLITHLIATGTQLSETRDKDPFCFLIAVYELKKQLEERGLYQDVERSFLNWFVNFSIWHVDTLDSKNSRLLERKLSKEVYPDFGLYKKEKSFFLDGRRYRKIQEIKTNYRWLRKLRKNLINVSKSEDKCHLVITFLWAKLSIRIKNKK